MDIVWPNTYTGTLHLYIRWHLRPDYPEEASLYLDTVPMPTPSERRGILLTDKLPDNVARSCDWEYVGEFTADESELARNLVRVDPKQWDFDGAGCVRMQDNTIRIDTH